MSETATKTYSLGAILTGITGTLLGEFSEFHSLAEWLCGYPVFTHQLPRLREEIEQGLRGQFPQFTNEDASDVGEDNWREWLDARKLIYGEAFQVTPMSDAPEQQNPLHELWDMVGPEKVFVIDPDGLTP